MLRSSIYSRRVRAVLRLAASSSTTSSQSAYNLPFNPSNTAAVFHDKSTPSLLFSAALFKLCGYRPIVSAASSLLGGSVPVASSLARLVVKQTVFPHFVSGESISEVRSTCIALKANNVATILDHSVEERDTEDAWDFNLKNKLQLLDKIAQGEAGASVRFVPLKCTALLCPKLLETMTALMATSSDTPAILSQLTAQEKHRLESGIARLEAIIEKARVTSVNSPLSILLDAEQSPRQPAIEFIARIISCKFNVPGQTCLVYNTYQCYTRRSRTALLSDLEAAKRGGYSLGVKLVRGAYMKTERGGGVDPILPTKVATDENYDSLVALLLNDVSRKNVALLVATHNRVSVEKAVSAMEAGGLPRGHPGVHFASLFGMVDNISAALGLSGFNSCKLVTFGSYEDVLPWLLRRLDENGDAFGAMQGERQLLSHEVRRRLTRWY